VETIEVDVAVVGAGLAGLTAGRDLVTAGREVVVLEARDRVGGRVYNGHLDDGTVVELGGQWIGPTQVRMAKLTADLGIETFPTYNEGDNLLQFGTTEARYRGMIPRVSPVVLADVGQAQFRLDRMARRVPLEAPWSAARAEVWDGQTLESWIVRNTRTTGGGNLLRLFASAVFAAEARDLSLLHALFYTHSGGGIDRLGGTKDGAQQDRYVGGSQRVATALADQLGARVRTESPVTVIEQGTAGVTIVTRDARVDARRVIVAIPPTLAARIAYAPALPGIRDQLTQRLPMGSVIKCHVAYAEPFWRDDGLSGQATSDRGPVKVVYDNSPPAGPDGRTAPGVLLAFLEGDDARSLGQVSAGDRRAAVVDALVRFFGPRAGAGHVVDYRDLDWAAEEWTRGCYGAHLSPGVWTSFGPALRRPVGRIHWAGTEMATIWAGYMDGAVQSGERAAAEVLTGD